MARQDLVSLPRRELRALDSLAQHNEEENRFTSLQRDEITRKIDLLPPAIHPRPDDRMATLAGDLLIPPRLLLIDTKP